VSARREYHAGDKLVGPGALIVCLQDARVTLIERIIRVPIHVALDSGRLRCPSRLQFEPPWGRWADGHDSKNSSHTNDSTSSTCPTLMLRSKNIPEHTKSMYGAHAHRPQCSSMFTSLNGQGLCETPLYLRSLKLAHERSSPTSRVPPFTRASQCAWPCYWRRSFQ
jgi:hypothetical protein